LGWRGGNRQWRHYEMGYLLLAALSTPLVLSVHSVVSFDFATSVVPGWHTTIFPPYFGGWCHLWRFRHGADVMMIPCRSIYGLHHTLTPKHIDMHDQDHIGNLTGTIVGYAYLMELFIAFYGGNPFEVDAFHMRAVQRSLCLG